MNVWICDPWGSYIDGIIAQCEAEERIHEIEEDLERQREADWGIPIEYESEIIPAEVALVSGWM